MEEFKSLFKTESTLDDLILEKLFRTSIILYICGYMSAIRLPREEHMNYIEKILSIPIVSSFIEDLLRDRVKVKIKGVKVELWLLPLSMTIFMILHEIHEFYVRDFTIPLFVISIPIHLPFAIPLFFLLTLGVSIWLVAITFNLNKTLRNILIEKIRRGKLMAYVTSLYVSPLGTLRILTRREVRDALWRYISKKSVDLGDIKLDNNREIIKFNNIDIEFKVRDIPEINRYLLSFFPVGPSPPSTWRKNKCIEAINTVLEFCNALGDQLLISEGNVKLRFERVYFDNYIDCSNWEVVFPQANPPDKILFSELFQKPKSEIYRYIQERVPRPSDLKFFIFTGLDPDEIGPIIQMFREYELNYKIKPLDIALEFAEKYYNKEGLFCVIIDEYEIIKTLEFKIYYDANKIPSQFIRKDTVENKFEYEGVKTNLLLEIMTKIGRKPIVLRPPEEIIDTNGILCLSDIKSTAQKLFGVLFTYFREGIDVEEEVQIYRDIEFDADEDTINISESSIETLAKKIAVLIGDNIDIDIILTKEWKVYKFRKFIDKLKNLGINVNRAYFVSSKVSRFVDGWVVENLGKDMTVHPYVIIDSRIAFLRTASNVRIYSTLQSLFIKLVYPHQERINEIDLTKILWLVKKRIYRIQECDVLTIPEPIKVFKELGEIRIDQKSERLVIPLRLLI